MSEPITISVTAEDIEAAVFARDCRHDAVYNASHQCPIARALCRHWPGATAGRNYVFLGPDDLGGVLMPKAVQLFVGAFDRGETPAPLTFVINR